MPTVTTDENATRGAHAAGTGDAGAPVCSILFTSDTHGCLTPTDYTTGKPGAACVPDFSGELAAMRAAGPTLFLDGGDSLQGAPLLRYWLMECGGTSEADESAGEGAQAGMDAEAGEGMLPGDGAGGEVGDTGGADGAGGADADSHVHVRRFPNPVAAAFGAMGLDAFTLGNHDFNYGRDVLASHLRDMAAAGAVCVCANVHDARGELAIEPHHVFELDGLHVGVTGVVTDYVNVWEAPEHLTGITVSDAFETARAQAEVLRKTCDVTICLYHGGFEEDLASGRVLARTTENRACAMARELDFDLLLTGHQHMPVASARFGNTLAAQPPANALAAVRVEMRVDAAAGEARDEAGNAQGAVLHMASALIKPQPSARSTQGEQALAALASLDTACATWLDQPVGTLANACPAQSKLEAALHGDALADLINEAQLAASGALVSCTSLGNDPAGLPAAVMRRDVCTAYRFMNTLMVIEVTPKQLKEALERCAAYLEVDSPGALEVSRAFLEPKVEHYNYDFYRGISYTVDLSCPVGERVTSMTLANGDPLPERLALALNDYRASGTGGYDVFASCKPLRTISTPVPVLLEEHIAAHPGCSVAAHGGVTWNW